MRISDTSGKIATSDTAIGDIVGGGGSTKGFTHNKSLTPDEHGTIVASTASTAELDYVVRTTSNIQAQINKTRMLTNENRAHIDGCIAGDDSTHKEYAATKFRPYQGGEGHSV